MKPDNQAVRTSIKRKRRELSAAEIRTASSQIASRFWRIRAAQRAKRIAIYMSAAGEVSCEPIMKTAWLRKIETFAPILASRQLFFSPLTKGTKTRRNCYRILEPVNPHKTAVRAAHFDIVIVPLVAFDDNANRLGMGGGYYDRTLAFTKHRPELRRPLLIGVAYDFQRVPLLHTQPWDVPLHAVITDKECYGSY